jgi:hypothetical protein
MTRLAPLALVLSLAALPAAAETAWSRTGPNGGSAAGSVACTAGDGAVTCDRSGSFVGPQGHVATREATRVTTRDGTTVSLRSTGPFGRVTLTERSRSR